MTKNKILEKFKDKEFKKTFIVFLIIFVLLLVLNLGIPLFHDDYGYASLTYGYNPIGVIGTNWNIKQLFLFLGNSYKTWGSRLIGYTFIAVGLKHGPFLFYFIQTFVVFGIIFFFYKIILLLKKQSTNIHYLPFLIFIFIFLCPLSILNDTMFWASASVSYVWGVFPISIFFYLYLIRNKTRDTKLKEISYFIFLFFISMLCSQVCEQYSIMSLVIIFIIIGNDLITKKFKDNVCFDLVSFFSIIIFSSILLFAPGNFARAKAQSGLPFPERIFANFSNYNFDLLRTCFYLYLILIILIVLYFNNKRILIFCLASLLVLTISIILNLTKTNYYIQGFFCAITFLLLLFMCFAFKCKIYLLIVICFYACVFSTVLTPVCGGRTYFPIVYLYSFLISILINKAIEKFYKGKENIEAINKKHNIVNKTVASLTIVLLGVFSFKYIRTTILYYENFIVFKENEKILRNYNGTSNTITLYKNKNEYARNCMPYDPNTRYIETWIKKYYTIPDNVTIIYIDR